MWQGRINKTLVFQPEDLNTREPHGTLKFLGDSGKRGAQERNTIRLFEFLGSSWSYTYVDLILTKTLIIEQRKSCPDPRLVTECGTNFKNSAKVLEQNWH